MTSALYHLAVLLIIAGMIAYAGQTFLPAPFNRIASFVAGIVAVLAVFGFIAFLLGVSTTPLAL